ncbi:hypothetical protein EOM81_11540 [bacterium]|nr:hypothetical protein [bacterium]
MIKQTNLIEISPWFKRYFTSAPVSVNFKHKLNPLLRKIEDSYVLYSIPDKTYKNAIYGINFPGIFNSGAIIMVDYALLQNSQESANMVINMQIQDYIRKNRLLLIAKLFQSL